MNKPDWKKIKAILFDIGNVLIDIDYKLTIGHFQAMSDLDFSQIVSYSSQAEIFNQYERGEISTQEFITGLKSYLRPEVSDIQIINAWNTMLVAYPEQKIKLLEKLNGKVQLYALSNINELHVKEMDSNIQRLYSRGAFSEFFDKAFYSNEIGMRKPEPRIYEYVIRETALNPSEIVFIDDKKENLLPANDVGMQTIHLEKPEYLYSFFEGFV